MRLFLFYSLMLILLSSPAFAATQTVEADGYYTVGDGAEENFSVARERAKQDALGRAAEMAAVYVEKFTAVKNHQLTSSEIKTLAAKVLNVLDTVFENTTEGNVFKIRCHVVARVEDDGAFASLLSDRQQLVESLQREREKDEQIAKLNRQMEELQKQYQAAKTDGERASIQQEAQANDVSFTAAQWVELGIRAKDSGKTDKAIECFNKAIALKPDYAEAYRNLGKAYWSKNCNNRSEHSKVFEYYNKAIELKPDYAEAYFDLGHIYKFMHEYNKAIKCFKKAVELKPDYVEANLELGCMLINVGNDYAFKKREYDKAIEYLSKGVEYATKAFTLDPRSRFSLQAFDGHIVVSGYVNLGYSYEYKDDYHEAIECYNKAIATRYGVNWQRADLYLRRGEAYEKLGDLKQARRDYVKAYELAPGNQYIIGRMRHSANW